jgi:hypothetical protein
MKVNSWLFVLFALLCCAIVVFAQDEAEAPIGEEPGCNKPYQPAGEEPQDSGDYEPASSEAGDAFCTLIALMCPDGSVASRNAQCEFICGEEPKGHLSDRQIYQIYSDFTYAYRDQFWGIRVGSLSEFPDVVVQPPESRQDACIVVTLLDDNLRHNAFPDVFNGARVIYTLYSPPVCSPKTCEDGTIVSCDDECPTAGSDSIVSFLFTPIAIILAVAVLSACCCCMRRRKCRAKCQQQMKTPIVTPQTPLDVVHEGYYPAEQYGLLQQEQEQTEIPMHPRMGQHMFPPLPFFAPHMMMQQNGAYPIMVQGPNGMWYPMYPQTPTSEDV